MINIASPFAAAFAAIVLAAAAQAEVPRVVADTRVAQSLTAMTMGDLGQPELLVQTSSDPHHVQLRPSQVMALQAADLVVWIGHEMSPWLEGPIDAKAARAVALLETDGTHLRALDHDHADDHGDHGGIDPHAWLDPGNAALWVAAIAEELAALDPDNATTYRKNAQAAAAEIADLTEEMHATLASAQNKHFIASHDAYGYLAERFGLHFDGALADTEAAPPSAQRIAELIETAQATPVACVFTEPGQTPKLAEKLAGETGAGTAVLDPSGLQIPPGPGLYDALMRQMAETIASCQPK